ncbi:LOW QUALITY PROTEIN: hypothetical protein Cgig2_016459 [Carnegiea gigantea]|uniref:SAM-dependent MTase DRM-type domain-containing protein n=1 Tax=Carnegiea gigantea TaxID=171969 RepID=A0A9Q1JLK2_9CARY|nr:LOW QUALITY PROTEIN: hypothetical protein Cgig2_016459 [Carnegiea gigantea]
METVKRTTSELVESSTLQRKKRKIINESLRPPNPMIGFGIPGMTLCVSTEIANEARGHPYFHYKNVACTPKRAQRTRSLYDIESAFIDSVHFLAAARKRGYIHNLLIENWSPLLPIQPKTIHEVLLATRMWWPSWGKSTQLNCLLTCIASAPLTDRTREIVETWNGEPPECYRKYVIERCKEWNLVWVEKYKVAVLEPDEMEMLLGFPTNHTGGVDSVSYHLSVLKSIFPSGVNVLSPFSNIGGPRSPGYNLAGGTEERAMALTAGTPLISSITVEY